MRFSDFLFWAIALLLIGAGLGWAWVQWVECTGMDHSILYCVQHVLG